MKKILIAVDPIHLNQSTLAFGLYLARLTRSRITGVFLENREADKVPMISGNYAGAFVDYELEKEPDTVKAKMNALNQKAEYFRNYYENHGVVAILHEDKGNPVEEIINESRYADILVIDAESDFTEKEELPGSFARKMMAEAECPVIIAPQSFDGINEIIFAYNGSSSCMYAIKQFADLFTELLNLRITILEIHQPGQEPFLHNDKFKEWLETRFSNVHYLFLSGQTETELISFLLDKEKSFIIMGAYGRNALSNFFKRSTADVVMKISSQPIFIAHQ